MIQAEGLCKQFDDLLAVDEVNLNVAPGRILVLLGPNGAGKTTTVRMLTSVLLPTRGSAKVAGFDVVKDAEKVRGVVGVLTEHHGLYGRMNAQEYLEFFGKLYGQRREDYLRQIEELLDRFGLIEFRKKRLGEYSKGMRQKLALTRAMLHRPMVLLLDEPTSAMDPESAHLVRESIRQLRSAERTILLCTHNLLEAEDLADEIAILNHGRIIFLGSAEGMKVQLLGQMEYEASFSHNIDGWQPDLPEGVVLTSRDNSSLRFRISNPEKDNPYLIQQMMERGMKLVTFQEVQHSLEKAYLQALARSREGDKNVG